MTTVAITIIAVILAVFILFLIFAERKVTKKNVKLNFLVFSKGAHWYEYSGRTIGVAMNCPKCGKSVKRGNVYFVGTELELSGFTCKYHGEVKPKVIFN